MKFSSLLSAVLLVTSLMSCSKQCGNIIAKNNDAGDTTTPACILTIISGLQNELAHNPRAVVYSYTYSSQKVYYITADCCDQYNLLYDGNCNVLCAPDGGITGHGDGHCPDFLSTRTDERLIWKDPR